MNLLPRIKEVNFYFKYFTKKVALKASSGYDGWVDLVLFKFINQFAGRWPILDALAVFFADYLGYFLIFFLFILILKNFRKYLKTALGALTAAILARFFFVQLIREIMPVDRPFLQLQANQLISHPPTGSFPSGHAAFFFALAFFLFFWFKKTGKLSFEEKLTTAFFFLGAFLIGLARIFCGLHWFSDILGGALVGLLAGWLTNKLTFNLSKKT